jgi:outer membrane protein insertion porin family
MKKITTLFIVILWTSILHLNAQNSSSPIIDYTESQSFKLGGLRVSGAQYLDQSIIRSITGLVLGQTIDVPGEDIAQAIKKLWSQNLFSDIQILSDTIRDEFIFLNISVTEKPRITGFEVNGIKKGDADDIKKKLESYKNRPLAGGVRTNIVNIIEDFYKEKGYLKPQIDISESRDSLFLNSSIVLIEVDKGLKVKIERINFLGAEQVETKKLTKTMKNTREKARLRIFKPEDKKVITDKETFKNTLIDLADLNIEKVKRLVGDRVKISFKSSKFNEDKYEEDKLALINYYNTIGYRDAKIVYDTVYYVNTGNIAIDIIIQEGKKYYFRNITWKGNAKYDDATLNKVLSIKKGDVYNRELLDAKLTMDPAGSDVSSLYYDDGYLFFSIQPYEVGVYGDSIDFEIRINEGPQATIKNIIIKGNDKTHENVIRRELYTKPGKKFSRSDLINSQRRIANLGFFDAEQLGVVPIPNPEDGTVDIEYTVAEKSADQIELSAGWGGNQGIIGTVGLSFNNFSWRNIVKKGAWSPLPTGDGQRLTIRIQSNGKRFQSYNFSFTEPWLGGHKPNALTISAFRQRFQSLDFNNNVLGKQITNSISLGLATRLKKPDDNFVLQGEIAYQNFNIVNLNQFFGTENTSISNGNFHNLNFKVTLARNNIDQPLFPRSGSNVFASVQFTPPYSSISKKDLSDPGLEIQDKFRLVEYHKWRFNAEWYTSLGRKGKEKAPVLKTSAKFGYLGYYNKNLGSPPFERFQVGGNGLPQNVILFGVEPIAQRGYNEYSQDGGDAIFNKFILELRYPFSLNPSATVYGLLFAEAANSYDSFKNYNPFKLNRSVGFGVRAFLPMFGLLGIDYGIRFDNAPNSPITKAKGLFDYIGKNGEITIILGFEPE